MIAAQTLDGARVPFRPRTLVEAIVAHAALGAGIGNGEPSLVATDRAAEALGAIVHVAQLCVPSCSRANRRQMSQRRYSGPKVLRSAPKLKGMPGKRSTIARR